MIWTVAPSDRLTMCRSAYTCATSRYLCVERGMGVAKVMGQCCSGQSCYNPLCISVRCKFEFLFIFCSLFFFEIYEALILA